MDTDQAFDSLLARAEIVEVRHPLAQQGLDEGYVVFARKEEFDALQPGDYREFKHSYWGWCVVYIQAKDFCPRNWADPEYAIRLQFVSRLSCAD